MKNCGEPYYSIFISVINYYFINEFLIQNIGPNLFKLKNYQWGPKLYNNIINSFTELQEYVPKKHTVGYIN